MSDVLAAIGLLLIAAASAASILLPPGRSRSLAMLAAVALFPALILGDQWHSSQIADVRTDPARIAVLLAIATAAIAALVLAYRRWPLLLPLAIVAALPFRIPLHGGGDTANLLVPLYLVIAAGALHTALRDWRGAEEGAPLTGIARWVPRLLAATVVLYALQALYSPDFSKGLQNACFFLVPFTVMYGLLSGVEWNGRLLRLALWVLAVEAVVFVFIGSVEFVTRSLFWNEQVIRSNEFHTYFRVNSVFWDPNVYGRYLALVATIAMAALLWARDRRDVALLSALIGLLWIGLVPTFSQSSFIALLAGLAVLAALRWSVRWTALAVCVGAIAATLVVTFAGGVSKVNFSRINIDTSGRANLVSGGADLFVQRPLWGYGSGSFQAAYKDHAADPDAPVSISHTEPVTVGAEQGLLGLLLYVALLAAALGTMGAGIRAGPTAARAAVIAAFAALLVHTMAYAGFYEDPITWVLLALGVTLAAASRSQGDAEHAV